MLAFVAAAAACAPGPEAERAEAAAARATPAEVFTLVCAHCHAGAAPGVPRAGVPADWNARETRDFDLLVTHAIEGFGNMPPLGSCSFCTEADLRAVVAMMVAGSSVEVPADRVPEAGSPTQ